MQAEAGKGSKPRNQQDHDAYAEGYDRIFGNRAKNNQEKEVVMDAKSIVMAVYKSFVDERDDDDDDYYDSSYVVSDFVESIPHVGHLLPLNPNIADEVTVEISGSTWLPVKYCMHDGHFICIVQAEGGCEGEGEYVSRVFGVFTIVDTTYYEGCVENFKVTVDYKSGQFCELNGSYYSYDGTTYDNIGDIRNVKPSIVPTVSFS